MEDSPNNQRTPEKLRSRRVRAHLLRIRERLRAALERGGIHRPAVDALDHLPVDWATLDLLTVALDLSDDSTLRRIVTQARSAALASLSKESSKIP